MNFFTSDAHFNHVNILQYCARPFSSVEEMNAKMIERWNETVGIDDTVYVVGDMFLGKPEDAKPIVTGLNGYKILILGNHDRSRTTMLECGFQEVHKRKDIVLKDGRKALLSHKPLPESTLSAYDLQIHGHRHSLPVVNGKRLNVCVDLWDYRPITEDELCAVKLTEAGYDEVEVRLNGEMIEVKATIRKEDMDGLLDHLHVFSSTIWNTRKEG